MKTHKTQILAFLLLYACVCHAQITVNKGIYKANFSNELHVPRWVSYYLYKGGGECDRNAEHFTFKNDMPELKTAKNSDYTNSGYQKGHLANAEDFAVDCKKEELTFRFYNCLPQTESANHDSWLHYESEIRKWSQNEKLYIITGGYFKGKKIGKSKDIAVPDWCWKVVQSCKTGKVLLCAIWPNIPESKMSNLTLSELEGMLNSKIILAK